MADTFTLVPRYGTLAELRTNINNINNGDLCFTSDSNQEFIKIAGTLSPVLGMYKIYETTLPVNQASVVVNIENLNKAVVHVCSDDDNEILYKNKLTFSESGNSLTITRTDNTSALLH